MRVRRLRLQATLLALLTLAGLIGTLARRQAAQDRGATGAQPRPVLIERERIVSTAPIPEVFTTATAPVPVGAADDWRPRSFAAALEGFERRPVRGAPFSAELVIETFWPHRDGSVTTRRTTYKLYRDGEGRTRRDVADEQAGGPAPGGDHTRRTIINDPVAQVTYVLGRRGNVAARTPLLPPPDSDLEELPRADERAATAGAGTPAFINLWQYRQEASLRAAGERSPATMEEALGQQEMEGVLAEGTRIIQIIRAGALSAGQPTKIVTERWVSPELRTVVQIKRNDSRFGESVYRLTNILRGEPAHDLFELPRGYEIRDGKDNN